MPSEQLEKYCSEETMMDALGQWMAEEGPLTWNVWQSGVASIRARYLGCDPETLIPGGMQQSTWSSNLWEKVSSDLLGPEWRGALRTKVLTSPRAAAAPRAGGLQAGPVDVALPPAVVGGGAPAGTSLRRGSFLWGLLTRGPLALRDADAATAPDGARARAAPARSLPGSVRAARSVPQAEFLIATPRGRMVHKARSDVAGLHPTARMWGAIANAAFAAQPAASLPPQIYDLLDAHAVDEDERSDKIEIRLNSFAEEVAGYSDNICGAAVNHEWYIRDLIGKWRNERQLNGSTADLQMWALRQLANTDFAILTDYDVLEMQVRCLSRLAGSSYEEATASLDRAWAQSAAGVLSQRSPGTAAEGTPVGGRPAGQGAGALPASDGGRSGGSPGGGEAAGGRPAELLADTPRRGTAVQGSILIRPRELVAAPPG